MRVHSLRRALGILVWNPTEQRIRAGWRVLVSFVAVLAGVVLAAAVPLPVTGKLQSVALGLAVRTCVVVGVAVTLVRVVDRRPLRALGFRPSLQWGLRLLAGVGTAFVIVSGATATMLVVGWATVGGTVVSPRVAFVPAVLLSLVYAVCVGIWEETLFRGLLLRNGAEGLTDRLSRRQAVAVSLGGVAVLHALLRLPGLSSARVLPFYVLASSLYGLAYVVTGDLAFPIGLHAGVDFGMLALFGFHDVSTFPALVTLTFTGPPVAVGVDGLVMFGWLLVGCVLVVVLCRSLIQTATVSTLPGTYRYSTRRGEGTTETHD
jgi:membrane protease YdiL (CAAX protease family)